VTIVVTGASGFIARRLVTSLLANGRDVIALTRDARKIDPRPRLRIIETDYRALELPISSTVVHLASVRNAPGTRTSDLADVNVALTERIARAAAAKRATRFIHIGTALVLGSSRTPLDDTAPLASADDPYIGSKAAGIRVLEAIEGLPLVTLLPAIVYGPDHPHARNRITTHMRRVLARPWRVAIGGASEPRNLVFVDDVVRAIVESENTPIGTRRLVAGENATQDDLERAVFAAAGRKPTPRVTVPRAVVRAAARTADAILRREQGWLRRVDTLLAPWCFLPGPSHTPLRDGVAATLRSL
jgi:UDP-glucose 4-epimerase